MQERLVQSLSPSNEDPQPSERQRDDSNSKPSASQAADRRFLAFAKAGEGVFYQMSADWSELQPLDGRGLVASNDAPIRDWLQRNIPASEHTAIRERVADCIRNKSVFELEHRVYGPDRSIRWTYSRAVPVLGNMGEIEEWIGSATDITDRKRAETSVRESEARFRQLADAMPQIVWSARPDGTLDYYNRRWFEYIDLPEGQPDNASDWAQFVHPEDVPRVAQAWSAAVATGDPYSIEFRVRNARGAYRWFLVRAEAVRDETDSSVRWFGTCTDIEDRKVAQARDRFLIDLDDAVRPLTDAATITATYAKMLGEHLCADRCAYADVEADEDTFNLTGDYNADGVASIVGRYAFTDFGQEVLRLMRENKPYVVEDIDRHEPAPEAVTAYRATMIQAVICVPLHKDGKFVAAMAVHQRVARQWRPEEVRLVQHVASRCWESIERARVERNLYRSEDRLRAVFEQTEAGIAQVDLTGRFVLANERYAQIVGRSCKELLALRMQDITHPDDLPGNLTRFQQMLADGSPFVIEKRYVRPDATEVWVSNSVSMLRDENGKPNGVVAATVDITDRRRAEQVLRESEAHARRIIDNTLAFVGVMTPDGTLTEANVTALRAGGLQREDVVGRKFWDCYWWSYDPQVQAQLREAVLRAAGGEVVRYDAVVRVAGDGRMPIEFMLSPVKDDQGRVTHLIPSGMDIAERLSAEEEVRRSQRQLASVIDNAPSAVFIKDVEGRYLLVNAPFERMAGVPIGSMTGKTDADLFPPEVVAQFRGEDERVAASREPMAFEESFEFKGKQLTFVTNKFPLRDEAGEVYAVCGIATDVTALKRAEAAVRESEQRLRLGLRAGRTGTWDWDIATNRVVWSEQLYEFHGLRPDEFGGTSEDFAKLVHPDDVEHVWSLIQEALRNGKPYEVEFRAVRPSGEVRWLFTTGQVTRDDSGNPVRMMGATIDTTDRKHAEADRERLLESERMARVEAERASRMKDEFLATLSHELRTPLNAILGWSQILAKNGDVPAEIGEGLQIIERNARAQTQIIEDLLDMSRIVNGKVRLEMQPVELSGVVHAAVDTVRPTAEAKGVRLQVVLDPLAGLIKGDPSRLQQVFWNILTNGVKFTPAGGRVDVALKRVNSHVEVVIADTGSGIKADFLPHVFDRFRQADASTTRRHGGLGLGLAIVKQLVEMHGGSVRVESAGEGMGSTFAVSLPLAPIRKLPECQESERRQPAGPIARVHDDWADIAGLRILVVDDEADARSLMKRLLEDRGAAVRTAASAGEAMTRLIEERPDVLISDIGMPDADGYALIRMIRALPPDRGGTVPAVALTAYARSEDRVRAMHAGFQNHVVKPVEPTALVSVVSSLAGRFAP